MIGPLAVGSSNPLSSWKLTRQLLASEFPISQSALAAMRPCHFGECGTTIPLFRDLMNEPDVINGDYSIHWLEKHLKAKAGAGA